MATLVGIKVFYRTYLTTRTRTVLGNKTNKHHTEGYSILKR